jgi:ATP-dependent DNA helicase RecG
MLRRTPSSSPYARGLGSLRSWLEAAKPLPNHGPQPNHEPVPNETASSALRAELSLRCRALAGLCIPPACREALEALAASAETVDAAWSPVCEESIATLDALAAVADDWLATSLTVLRGIGPKRAEQLGRRGLGSVGDLLFSLPAGYEDRRRLTPLAEIEVGRPATFFGVVREVRRIHSGKRGGGLEVDVEDESGKVVLRWFRFADGIEERLEAGMRVCASGEVRRYRFTKQVAHPEIEVLGRAGAEFAENVVPEQFRRIVPRYKGGLGLSPLSLRRLTALAIEEFSDVVPGYWNPGDTPSGLEIGAALREVHAPAIDSDFESLAGRESEAHARLILEELYLLELGLALRKENEAQRPGISLCATAGPPAAAELPFALTGAQARVVAEITADLAAPHPMNRLLQGDVGCGKTVVAYLAVCVAAAAGHQSALMAPTELLAEQHLRSLRQLMGENSNLRMAGLTASRPRAEATAVRRALAAGELDLVVGTHALLQESVRFASLALAVIDEQHRFGVQQRAALAKRGPQGLAPHVMVMTATPIPRTLALTLYGDLDVSVIDERPPGRTPVRSEIFREGEGEAILDRVKQTLARDEQVFVVYPLIEKSEKVDLRNATESARRLAHALDGPQVDLIHGRLEASVRQAAMDRFGRGETRVLVATSVVEVGVDIPNATLMVVEHAERFGLAQLHQLRGRVGRGQRPGHCLFVSRGGGEDSEARLRALAETDDGFRIADADLRIRGPGEVLGTQQHGVLPDLRLADLARDARLLTRARDAAFERVRLDPGLAGDPALRRAVEEHWGDRIALKDVG